MPVIRWRRLGLWAAPVLVLALGFGLWYARHHGWLTRSGQRASADGGKAMDMAGMNMEGNSNQSDVAGHAKVTIRSGLQQRIGVTIGEVEKAPLEMTVRTVGIVQPDETRVVHLHLKVEGWVEELFVNYTGQMVQKGDPLLAIYSPQFLTTQEEYLNALRNPRTSTLPSGPSLAESARRRLQLWDVPTEEIDELEKDQTARKSLTLRSPIKGTVLMKNTFQGQYVMPTDELYTVADLSTVWVQAKVYEYELPHIALDMPARVTLAALPDEELTGKVVFVQPTIDEATRTAQVRIELSNQDGRLKPGMFAHIEISHAMGQGLLVPTSAVIRTGEQDIAYRVEQDNRFVPVEVKIGDLKFGDRFQVLGGLDEGEKVVTSANFLIDSESRLRAGGGSMAGMAGMEGMDMGTMQGMDMDSNGQAKKHKGTKSKERGMKDMEGMDHSKMKH